MNKSVAELQAMFNQTKNEYSYNPNIPTEERIQGAIMGAIIGDALGVGCHWIYDYEELWRDYGPWITDYTDPKATNDGGSFEMISAYRYGAGVRAGMSSQSGQLLQVLLETVAGNCHKSEQEGQFNQEEYVRDVNHFFEHVLLPEAAFESDIDIYNSHKGVKLEHGTYFGSDAGIKCFSGRYTNEEVRLNFDLWFNKGAKNGRWWAPESNVALTSTSEGAQWGVVLAALYRDPRELFYKAWDFLNLWYVDKAFITTQIVYIMTVHAMINNIPIEQYENYFIALFDKINETNKLISSFDDLMLFTTTYRMAKRDYLMEMKDLRFAPIFFG
ncbi:MAG: ADP-ribosylglycohydrolase family protein, partial [Clostridiales bacterium]